jgi:hypothetical protein
MEYIQSTPSKIVEYTNDFHDKIKNEFQHVLTKMYREELDKYSNVIETIIKLPFIQDIINENKLLKLRIEELQSCKMNMPSYKTDVGVLVTNMTPLRVDDLHGSNVNVQESKTDSIVLEIVDKPMELTKVNINDVQFVDCKHTDDSVKDASSEEDDDSEEEDSDDDALLVNAPPTFPTVPPAPLNNSNLDSQVVNKSTVSVNVTKEVEEEEADADEAEEEEAEEEEVEEEEVEEEEAEEEEAEEEEAEEEEAEEEEAEEEESEVIEIEIDGKVYYCDGEENGNIYEDVNGEVGDVVGVIKDGEAQFL